MNRYVIMLIMLLIGCVSGAALNNIIVPARAQGQVGPTYEYDAVRVANSLENDKQVLAKYGREGWRLVTATEDGPWRTLYFERQLPGR